MFLIDIMFLIGIILQYKQNQEKESVPMNVSIIKKY